MEYTVFHENGPQSITGYQKQHRVPNRVTSLLAYLYYLKHHKLIYRCTVNREVKSGMTN